MTESQAHGFTWENSILQTVFGIQPGTQIGGYTRKHDVNADENTLDNVNISIKTSGSSSIDMGDARRIFSAVSGETLRLVLVQYKQEGEEKVLQSVSEVDLMDSARLLFNEITLAEITALHEFLKSIPPGKASPEMVAEYKRRSAELNKKSGILQFRPKVDSAKQRRLQCSIPFSKIPAEKIVYQNTQGIYKGHQIPLRIPSGRRVRH